LRVRQGGTHYFGGLKMPTHLVKNGVLNGPTRRT
jgi:hypothetical protein